MRLSGLKTSLYPNLLDRPQPAEEPGAFEERGRQVLAHLADSERGDERGGGRYRSRVPDNQTLQRLPLPMEMVRQHLKHVRQLQVAALYARLGPTGTGEQTGSRIA